MTTQERRAAWRTYAAATLRATWASEWMTAQEVADRAAVSADAMLAEEENRFPPRGFVADGVKAKRSFDRNTGGWIPLSDDARSG